MPRSLSASPESPARPPNATATRRASPTRLESLSRNCTDWDPPSGAGGLSPANSRDMGPSTRARPHLQLTHEPPGTAQAKPQPATRGISIAQGQLDVGYAPALVLERHPYPSASPVLQGLDRCGASAAVLHGVAREFAGRGNHLGLLHQPEPQLHRPRS